MDPISAIGLIESSLGLALQFGSAAKALHDVAGKYKNAGLSIKSLAQNLDILQLSWTQIVNWFQERSEEESLDDDVCLTKRLEGFLETGDLVMGALQHDLQAYNIDHLGFSRRSKFIWNEPTLQGHQSRIRDQALSMSLFLQAVNLPSPRARTIMLRESEPQFQKSDESAYSIDSIVPSRMSISTNQRDSYASGQSHDTIEYRPLSFEKRLFMSKVYMRSSKTVMIKELSKAKTSFKRKDTAAMKDQTMSDREAIGNGLDRDSLLATSYGTSFNNSPPLKSHTYSQSGPHLSGNKFTNLMGMTLNDEFIWACRQGNNFHVKRLADRGVDLHTPCNETQYPGSKGVHVAAMYGHLHVVETLLGYGGMIEEEGAYHRWRPLHVAARSGQAAVVKFLIQNGAQIDARACEETQPIHEASRSGSLEILNALIEAGAAIDCSDTFGYQPLHYVSKISNMSVVIRYLLQKGAKIEAKTFDGSRPLHLACASDPTNFRTLIALGAEVDYADGSESVIQAAIRLESVWAIEILVLHGVDPNRQNDRGETILHNFARIGNTTSKSLKICQLLLDNGADVNVADKAGEQILHCVAAILPKNRAGTLVTAQFATLVLDQCAEIDATNKNGVSPLYLAIQGDNRPLSKLLLRSGARRLKKTVTVRAEVRATTLLDTQTPRYTVDIWRKQRELSDWDLSTQSFELSIDDELTWCVRLGGMSVLPE